MKYKFEKNKIKKYSPIGVFDSGIGGLTIVHEIAKQLPNEKVVYIGDDAHFPYGEKTADQIREYSREICQKLLDRGVKLMVVACNTITTAFLEEARKTLPVPVVGVVGAGARAAAAATKNNNIGILATKATVDSGMYEAEIKKIKPEANVTSVAAFKFVNFVENELEMVLNNPKQEVFDAISEYTKVFVQKNVDTVLLGCTHFPPLQPLLQQSLTQKINFVSPGDNTIIRIKEELEKADLSNTGDRTFEQAIKSYEIHTTGWDK